MRYYQPMLPLIGTTPEGNPVPIPSSALPWRSKLFFLIKPPPCLSDEIYGLASSHVHGRTNRQPHPAALLHVSLLAMGQFDEPPYHLLPRIKAAIGSIRARPIRITLDESALYGGARHLALTSSGRNSDIQAFVRMLHGALTRHNLPRQTLTSISPHVTIIYGYGRRELVTRREPYEWLADEFALVYSHNGERRHEEFYRWRFDAEAAPYAKPPRQLYLPINLAD